MQLGCAGLACRVRPRIRPACCGVSLWSRGPGRRRAGRRSNCLPPSDSGRAPSSDLADLFFFFLRLLVQVSARLAQRFEVSVLRRPSPSASALPRPGAEASLSLSSHHDTRAEFIRLSIRPAIYTTSPQHNNPAPRGQ